MKCNGCVSAIKKVLTKEPGVTQFDINLTMKQVEVNYELSAPLLIAVFSSAGFEATEVFVEQKGS